MFYGLIKQHQVKSVIVDQSMKSNILLLIVLLSLSSVGQAITSYTTNPDRTTTVEEMCSPLGGRDGITNSDATKQQEEYNAQMALQFTPSGTDLYFSIEQGGISQVQSDWPTLQNEFIMYVAAFLLFLIFLCFSCLCCCCCCCCGCCPSGCCAKKQGTYTKKELLCPTIFLLAALTMLLVISILGLAEASDIETSVKASGCSVAVLFDDLINGNVTSSGRGFWAGMYGISTQLAVLDSNFAGAIGDLDSIKTGSAIETAIQSAYTQAQASLDVTPNVGGGGARAPDIDYYYPFGDQTATTVLQSDFPVKFGSNDGTTYPDSLVFDVYTTLYASQQVVDLITSKADTVSSSFSSGTLSSMISSAVSVIEDFTVRIQDVDAQFYDLYSRSYGILGTITISITGFYAGLIGLSALAILATILTVICSRFKCRHLVYFICFILVIIGILCLLLSVIFSVIVPVFYFGCDFLDTTFSSKQGFMSTVGSNIDADTVKFVTTCLAGESGDLLDSSFMGTITSTMDDFRTVIEEINGFQESEINGRIDTSWGNAYSYLRDSYTGAVIDFSNSTAQSFLQTLSKPNSSTYSSCTDAVFRGDSWIPTTLTPNEIACQLGSAANQATATQCAGNFNPSGGLCNSCMDSQSILPQLDAASGNSLVTMVSNIMARYNNDANCQTFADNLAGVWRNYYYVKQTTYPAIISRAVTTDNDISAYTVQITAIATAFTSAITNIESAMDTVVDPQYGLIAGFNCALFGEDILLIMNTICSNLFTTTYFLRLSLGIAGIAVFFTMIFSVCMGVRVYKHVQASDSQIDQQKVAPHEMTNENLFEGKGDEPKTHKGMTYFA